ncbi:copper chaperone PCu(A)C [Aliishimia ponticola]|uniref:Copper chaperone PCu(A)C n=1 Tax=Aliishimia ponticola TaxID=2499833 RepID=A0A4S4NCF1_9RHOB|nr:copper chaperone PCu(A)C [Aliishimia ponticola]THH36157.1 copper chaperone PCu(A)C [Aliishimia ponticola]
MTFSKFLAGGAVALLTLPAFADDAKIEIIDPYARSGAKTGAAFFTIVNHSESDDRLVAVSSDVAPRVELHTHIEDANGVMKMREVEDGFAVPARGEHALARGGDHVMFMGLPAPLEQGAKISITLTFEQAGDIVVELPVDNERKGGHGMKHGHGHKSD